MNFSKLVAIAAITGFSIISQAASNVSATYSFGINDLNGTILQGSIITVSVVNASNGNKALKVVERHSSSSIPKEKTISLGPILAAEIASSVSYLAGAEIEVLRREIVCMMMPGPFAGEESLSVENTQGGLVEVLGPQGCWLHETVAPKESYFRVAADNLSAKLKVLALVALKK